MASHSRSRSLQPDRRTRHPDLHAKGGLQGTLWAQTLLPAFRGMLPHIHVTAATLDAPLTEHGPQHLMVLQAAFDTMLHEMRATVAQLATADCATQNARECVVQAFLTMPTVRQQTSAMPLVLDVSARVGMRDLLDQHGDELVFDTEPNHPAFRLKGVGGTLAYLLNDGRFDDVTLYGLAADLLVSVVRGVGNSACVLLHFSWLVLLVESGRCGDFQRLAPADWLRADTWTALLAERMPAEQAVQRALMLVRLACVTRCRGHPFVLTHRAGAQTADCTAIAVVVKAWWQRVRREPISTVHMTNAPSALLTLADLDDLAAGPVDVEEGEIAVPDAPLRKMDLKMRSPARMPCRLERSAGRTSGRAMRLPNKPLPGQRPL